MDDELTDADDARVKGDFLIDTPNQVGEQWGAIRALGFEKLQICFLTPPTHGG